jgi:hypothetical protein
MHLCPSDFHMLSFTFPAAPTLVKGNWVGRLDHFLWFLEVVISFATSWAFAASKAFATSWGQGDFLCGSTFPGDGGTILAHEGTILGGGAP